MADKKPKKSQKGTTKKNGLPLKVAEALSKDVGRGIARIDPAYMENLGVSIGDIVQIDGKRKTVAKIMPTYMDDRGKKLIQIDGVVRENAKSGLDDRVFVDKASHNPASQIVLTALTAAPARGEDARYIGRLFEGLPLVSGDRVRATLFGTRSRDFKVVSTSPEGVVLVTPTTNIKIKGEKKAAEERGPHEVSYEDVGGLGKEINKIREMIELPLRYPQVFDRLGIDPPKGVLLHGPPGTGKTLIARAVAHESEANFFSVNGPEIVHKFYGESEAHLRSIFEKAAEAAPSIIFIDEIDAIAPKRAEVTGDVEKRIVATLLAMMDGLKGRGQVIVIGATNIPDVMDPALRRPGRFDREIVIGIPDKNGREQILDIHTRGMPLTEDVDIGHFAAITHGYVGADLEALAREAAMISLRKVFDKVDFNLDEIPYETLVSLEVNMDCFIRALNEVTPSAIREVFVEVPDVKWEDVGGLEDTKEILKETVEWPLKYERLFAHANAKAAKGILLDGPPGTGKTLLAKALANESEVNFISIKGPELISKWVGESEKGVREIFKKARQAAPCILFFDEIDSIAPRRGGGEGDSGVTQRVISQFLTELDGLEELKGVVILGATNRKDILDPALIRTGRFDLSITLPIPDFKSREAIFEVHTRNKPLEKKINFKEMARATEGMVGSDIEEVCRQAIMLALREFIHKYEDDANKECEKFKVKASHFTEALKYIKKQKRGTSQ